MAVFDFGQVRQTREGVLKRGIQLIDIIRERLIGGLPWPAEQDTRVHTVTVALERRRKLIGLRTSGQADEEMIDLDRRPTLPLDDTALPVPRLFQNSRSEPLE
jgi:hypothetical protein